MRIKEKLLQKDLLLFVFVIIFLGMVACDRQGEYKDTIERPTDIPELIYSSYVKYPEKLSSAPTIDISAKPSCREAIASEGSGYSVTNGDSIKIEYTEVSNWGYVYLPVDNYQTDYGNIKITALGSGAERIAIQAIYFEMYDDNKPPVTIYRGDIIDGEQYFISSFNRFRTLNANYNQMEDTDLSQQTIIGFCIFIDSNPSQMKVSDKEGSLEIKSIKFLQNGDPELEDRYVTPTVVADFMDEGYTALTNTETGSITINREANTTFWSKAYLAVSNYSSDYTAFSMKINTTGVKNIYIALQFNVEGHNWLDVADVYQASLLDGDNELYIDFSATQPTDIDSGYQYAAGYYIKNYRINNILIYLDTHDDGFVPDFDGSCVINELKFERTATEGTTISKGWNSGSNFVQLGKDIIAGGTGSITYQWHNEWYCMTMPVLNYETATKFIVKFEAKEGLDYIGIALNAGGSEVVLRSCWEKLNGSNSEIEEKKGKIEGLVESIEYSKISKIYTITFDFSQAVKLENFENKSVNELAVTAIMIYFTDPNEPASMFDGSRTVRFISMEFVK